MGWLRLENTDVSVLDILEMLAENRSTDEILRRFPSISRTDIASAAATARYLIIYHWAVCRSPDSALLPDRRELVPTSRGGNWSPQEELELARLFRSGSSIDDMARIFITMKTDIIECLKRLNLM
jgi:hypothetical protein